MTRYSFNVSTAVGAVEDLCRLQWLGLLSTAMAIAWKSLSNAQFAVVRVKYRLFWMRY